MEHIKKIIICIIILIFSSGCTVNYTLKINEDESVNEDVEAIESSKIVKSKTGLTGDKAVNYLYDMFKRDDQDSNISYTEENNRIVATTYASYPSLDEYQESFTSDVFDNINVTKESNNVTINATQKQRLGGTGRTLIYDKLVIKLVVPFDVVDNNADSIDGNTYIWNINKSKDLKNIKLTYNIKNKKNSANINVGNDIINIKYEYIGIGLFVFIILIIFVVVSIKNKKNNII